MKKYRELHISGALLDKNQLSSYMEKLASSHNIKNSSSKDTYPIPMLKKDYEDRGVSGQRLLAPIVLDVDGNELQIIRENKEKLEKMGFDIQEFGRNSALIHETPFISDEDEIKALALEVISIMGDSRPLGTLSFEERILDTISCKYAIKANKKLSVLEMEALASDVEEMENAGITTCPHGRPIKVRFTKREIEKMFKRIV